VGVFILTHLLRRRDEALQFSRRVVRGDPPVLVAKQVLPVLKRHARRPESTSQSVLQIVNPHPRVPPCRRIQRPDGARNRHLLCFTRFGLTPSRDARENVLELRSKPMRLCGADLVTRRIPKPQEPRHQRARGSPCNAIRVRPTGHPVDIQVPSAFIRFRHKGEV